MQSRKHSIWETTLNTASGFIVSWALTLIVLPWFGAPVSASSGFGITTIFTVVSVIRSYFWRRLFNKLQRRLS
jgi:hypothetical protein